MCMGEVATRIAPGSSPVVVFRRYVQPVLRDPHLSLNPRMSVGSIII